MSDKKAIPAYLPWLIWGLAAFYFFADYSARVSPSVMLPELQQAFNVTAVGLGSLAAYFYYPYVAMQIPVGLLVDRYSIRYLLAFMSVITGIACYIFGSADSLYAAQVGRFLIGFSAAFAFVSTLKLAAEWFPARRLGLLAGLTQGLGMAGAFFGAYPVSLGVSSIGWRSTMFVLAGIFIVTAILIFLVVRDSPHKKAKAEQPTSESKLPENKLSGQFKVIFSNPQTWLNAIFAGLIFAPTAVIGEYWGASFFQFGRGFEYHAASLAIGFIFIGWMVGGPLAGWISDRVGRRKPLMFVSAISGFIIVSMLLFLPNITPLQAYPLLFIYGLTHIGVSIAYAVATEINPKRTIGLTLAFTNMASIMIGAIMQPVVGKLLDLSIVAEGPREVSLFTMQNFQAAFWVLPICSLLALFLLFFIKETYCRPLTNK